MRKTEPTSAPQKNSLIFGELVIVVKVGHCVNRRVNHGSRCRALGKESGCKAVEALGQEGFVFGCQTLVLTLCLCLTRTASQDETQAIFWKQGLEF